MIRRSSRFPTVTGGREAGGASVSWSGGAYASVTVPGVASAARAAWSRWALGSTLGPRRGRRRRVRSDRDGAEHRRGTLLDSAGEAPRRQPPTSRTRRPAPSSTRPSGGISSCSPTWATAPAASRRGTSRCGSARRVVGTRRRTAAVPGATGPRGHGSKSPGGSSPKEAFPRVRAQRCVAAFLGWSQPKIEELSIRARLRLPRSPDPPNARRQRVVQPRRGHQLRPEEVHLPSGGNEGAITPLSWLASVRTGRLKIVREAAKRRGTWRWSLSGVSTHVVPDLILSRLQIHEARPGVK